MPDPSDLQAHDDAPIEHSPLERDVTREGATVRVFIYRGREDPGWLLEIEDELGGSTVWQDPFDSDQEALDEALQTIEKDGIHSFTEQADQRALWKLAIAQPAIAELKRILASSKGAMSFDRACGVFAAVVSTPELLAPTEWLDLIKGEHVFEDLADVQRFTNGAMALYNEVLRALTELGSQCCPPPEDHDAVGEFCVGYLTIALRDPALRQDVSTREKLIPMCVLAGAVSREKLNELAQACNEDAERWLQRAREELAQNVASMYAHWAEARQAAAARHHQPQRRAAPKVGRNERCPCGSGKKFKKCCAQ
jgi:uncharacterized protein